MQIFRYRRSPHGSIRPTSISEKLMLIPFYYRQYSSGLEVLLPAFALLLLCVMVLAICFFFIFLHFGSFRLPTIGYCSKQELAFVFVFDLWNIGFLVSRIGLMFTMKPHLFEFLTYCNLQLFGQSDQCNCTFFLEIEESLTDCNWYEMETRRVYIRLFWPGCRI